MDRQPVHGDGRLPVPAATIGTPSLRAHLYWIGGSYNISPFFVVRAGVYRTDRRDSPNDAMSYALAMAYTLSKRTDLYLNASFMDNKGASTLGVVNGGSVAPGVNRTGVVAGIRHIFWGFGASPTFCASSALRGWLAFD